MPNAKRFPHHETAVVPERALLVGVELPGAPWSIDETMDELERLTETAGAQVVSRLSQKMQSPNARTFIGSGKADEVVTACRSLAVDLVIFDDELTPSQQSNLERLVGRDVKVIDRTALILDIFALHATSREGMLQVRLAQNEYLYPRLRGMWAHLASNRMGGGVGSRFGEGESQLEVDRRMVRKRITSIKRELEALDSHRELQRGSRDRSGMERVSLAGYTNAGKSSLQNRLTGAGVLSYDMLFATLDATTRRYVLPEGREITLTDTVGFIQKLPTTLVESFKSTLDEIVESDLIIHVVDASSPVYRNQMETVDRVFGQIGAAAIDRIEVFNKCDLIDDEEVATRKRLRPDAVFVSAQTGQGIDELIGRIASVLAARDRLMNVCIPFERGDLVSLAHERGAIVSERCDEDGTHLQIRANEKIAPSFEAYIERPPA